MMRFAEIRWSIALWEDAPAVADDEGGPLAGGDGAVFPPDPERDALAVKDDRGEVGVAGDALDLGGGEDLNRGGGRRRGTRLALEGFRGHGDVDLRALPAALG